jgi:carboxylesterase type B
MFPFLLLPPLFSTFCLAAPQVTIGATTINGVASFNEDLFAGIPFAQPPTGANRFKPPVVLSSLPPGAFDGTKFGAECLQSPVIPYMFFHTI